MSLALNSLISRNAGLLQAEVSGEIVLMSPASGTYYGLDDVGSDVWRHLAEPIQVTHLCETLLQTYDADPAVIRDDVMALLAKLAEEGLIKCQPAGA